MAESSRVTRSRHLHTAAPSQERGGAGTAAQRAPVQLAAAVAPALAPGVAVPAGHAAHAGRGAAALPPGEKVPGAQGAQAAEETLPPKPATQTAGRER